MFAKALSVEIFDKIISEKKFDINQSPVQFTLNKEFIEQYIQSLILGMNQDRSLKNQVLDAAEIYIENEDVQANDEIPDEILQEQRKVRINSRTLDAVSSAYGVSPSDIDEALDTVITMSAFGCIWEMKQEDDGIKSKTINVVKSELTFEEIQNALNNSTSINKNISKQHTVEVFKTNFSNAVRLRDEYIKRLGSDTLFNKEFIEEVCKLIKINGVNPTFEEFISFCNKAISLAYELVNIIISYSYNTSSFEKKSQFSITIL